MAASHGNSQALGGILQALLTNGSHLTANAINQFAHQVLAAQVPGTTIPVTTNNQLGINSASIGNARPHREAIMARIKADKMRKERVKLRPLNAFICFRSYYSPVFASLTQKVKSGLIRELWAMDMWKHFWAIEAKAYSELRDASLGKVSLEKFLTETVGMFNIIPADDYLKRMGWQLVVDEPAMYHLVKVDPAATVHGIPFSSNLSAADIVKHCYDVGLVDRPPHPRVNNVPVGNAMAFAANPTGHPSVPPPAVPNVPIVVQETKTAGKFTDKHGFFSDYAKNLSIETATEDVQRALEDYADDYPYDHHFHPAVHQRILAFDPNLIQHDFDPFDIADYVNFDGLEAE